MLSLCNVADFPLIKEGKKSLDKVQIQFQKPFQMRGSVSEHYISGYVCITGLVRVCRKED
jgi:hypothetical protein